MMGDNRANVFELRQRLPRSALQADRLKRLAKRDQPIALEITIFADRDKFREQRSWRFCLGLY